MAKERGYTIYALIDPRDSSIRYIGIINNPDQRLKEHLRGRGGNPPKSEWVSELRRLGLVPIMQPLETGLSLPAALERKSFLIQHYLNSGNALVNLRVTPYLSYTTRKNIPPNEAVTRKSAGSLESRITRRKVTVRVDELILEHCLLHYVSTPSSAETPNAYAHKLNNAALNIGLSSAYIVMQEGKKHGNTRRSYYGGGTEKDRTC